jgi:hypothetical protein
LRAHRAVSVAGPSAAALDQPEVLAGVEADGVDVLAVELDGEMQVWSGGVAAVADFGDGLAGVDKLADGDRVAVVVSVGGDHAAAVVDADPQAVALGESGGDEVPSAAARMRVPIGAARSTPACKR